MPPLEYFTDMSRFYRTIYLPEYKIGPYASHRYVVVIIRTPSVAAGIRNRPARSKYIRLSHDIIASWVIVSDWRRWSLSNSIRWPFCWRLRQARIESIVVLSPLAQTTSGLTGSNKFSREDKTGEKNHSFLRVTTKKRALQLQCDIVRVS